MPKGLEAPSPPWIHAIFPRPKSENEKVLIVSPATINAPINGPAAVALVLLDASWRLLGEAPFVYVILHTGQLNSKAHPELGAPVSGAF